MQPLRRLPVFVFVSLIHAAVASGADRPNILWITAEDMSPTLGCYGDNYATSPNIDALAEEGVRYTRAFASAPVCSPARACLINGLLAPTQGTHQMRSVQPIPKVMKGFPAWLREAGYYTTNNVKTDYNSANAAAITAASWNECSETAHWRGRPDADEPFFAIFNLMTSHQSRTMVWPYEQFVEEVQSKLSPEEIHDPDNVPVPPYYPDTPVIRKTLARYYDCVTAMDKEVGALLAQLEEDGLAEDTIVFFYSDHGSGMPRHKRALLDSGMHVPMVIRFPEKYRDWAPGDAGSTTDRLVSFEDFAPTVLSLAGMTEMPRFMEGTAFLGAVDGRTRRYVFGHRDRVDEVIDLARSVRDERFLYIRNYMPHLGYNQPTAWPDQGEIRHEFYRLADAEKMTPAQWHFAGPTRPREELYDCEADPQNLNNLVEVKEHAATLKRLRKAHTEWLRVSRDLGFVPEIELERIAKESGKAPYSWARGKDGGFNQAAVAAEAGLVGTDDGGAFMRNLKSKDASVRYWGAVGLSAMGGELPANAVVALKAVLSDDPSEAVRIEAANALARHGEMDVALPVLTELLEDDNTTVVLYAARTIEMLGDDAKAAHEAMKAVFVRFDGDESDPALFIRFTAGGFLERVRP